MSKQLTLMLDNVSQRTSQLPVQITRHAIEDDCKEEWETEFGNYVAHCVWFLFMVYLSHFSL